MRVYLDFEKPIADLESKIEELRRLSGDSTLNILDEVGKLEKKLERMLRETYSALNAWQKMQVARHYQRPHTSSYINELIDDFTRLSGDRLFGEDFSILCGIGRFRGRSIMIIGNEKGIDTESRIKHNFGMARPEGYRKAQRLMKLADHFNLPVVTLIDTPGAYPGIDAEERGQAGAIAKSIESCLALKVPIISIIIGEGGSGGAIALAAANQVLMLEHSVYSVISPEGCASILWRDPERASEAADALRFTAQDLKGFGIIDKIVKEPIGGAQREPREAISLAGEALESALAAFDGLDGAVIKRERHQKFLKIGTNAI